MSAPTDSNNDDGLPGVADDIFRWLVETHIQPEADRRALDGRMAQGEPVYRAQVLLYVDRPTEVRLNEEVVGSLEATAARAITEGETVLVEDIAGIVSYELADDDLDAAHFTILRHRDGWSLAFDGRYNRARAAKLLAIADEFIHAAEAALAEGHLHAFSENAFSAAELLATSELLPLPDERILKAGHGTTRGLYNLWAKHNNTEQRFADLLNELEQRRAAARYARKALLLERHQAERELAALRDMRAHAQDHADGTAAEVGFNLTAHKDLRRGEVIAMPPGGALQMLRGKPHGNA